MTSWQITPIDWLVTEPATVRALLRDETVAVEVCDQTSIGLAFALVKVRGACPSNVADMATAAIDRQTIALDDSPISGSARAIRRDGLDRMRTMLQKLP